MEALLDECVALNRIKPVDSKVVAVSVIGAFDGLMLQRIMDRNAFD